MRLSAFAAIVLLLLGEVLGASLRTPGSPVLSGEKDKKKLKKLQTQIQLVDKSLDALNQV